MYVFSAYQISSRTTAVLCRLQFRRDISPWLLFLLIRILTWFPNLRWVFIRIILIIFCCSACPVFSMRIQTAEWDWVAPSVFSCTHYYLMCRCWLSTHTEQQRQGPVANPVGAWAGWCSAENRHGPAKGQAFREEEHSALLELSSSNAMGKGSPWFWIKITDM